MEVTMKQEVVNQTVQATPSLALLGAWFVGITLHQWFLAASIGFILLQAAYLIWKWRKESKNDKQKG